MSGRRSGCRPQGEGCRGRNLSDRGRRSGRGRNRRRKHPLDHRPRGRRPDRHRQTRRHGRPPCPRYEIGHAGQTRSFTTLAANCQVSAAKNAPASCTASTRTPPAFWSSPSPTRPITALPPSSRITRRNGCMSPFVTACRTSATRVSRASGASASRQGGVIKITTQLARHKTDRQRQAVLFQGGRHAVTRVKLIETYGTHAARVHCRLETGRTHQIRVHMTHVGHALIGDPVYGGRRRLPPGAASDAEKTLPGQALHAATLGFRHPISGGTLRFESPLPEHLVRLHTALANM